MKRLLFFLLIFTGFQSIGQINCIISPSDTTLCYHDSLVFNAQVTGTRPFTYKWLKNSVVIPGETDSIFTLHSVNYQDTAIYQCIITHGLLVDTSNTAHLKMHPRMKIDTLYRYNELGCPGTCKGQYRAHVSGGAPPYNYDWGGGHSQDTIVFGLCQGSFKFTVTDTNHCSVDSSYYLDVLKLPKVEFTSDPKDTVYLSKPMITVSFPDSSKKHMTNWEWDFGDTTLVPNVNPANHYYKHARQYSIVLHFTDPDGCDTTITIPITVKIAKLKIPNVFTPDHDNYNETFMISLDDDPVKNFADVYLSNEIEILDRWGRKVYSKTNYRSNRTIGDWNGDNLSDGVYYYLLKCHGYYSDEVFKGSVTILRSH